MTEKKEKKVDVGNDLMDDFDKFENFVTTKWKSIVYFCIAIVVFVAIGATGYSIKNSMDAKALTIISAAQTIEELNTVIAKYPGNPAVINARIKLATLFKNNKDYDKAIEQYSQIISASQTLDIQKWKAELNIGYISELKDTKLGAQKFAEISVKASLPDYVRAEANFAAGRLFLSLNEKDKAVSFLKNVESAKDKFNEGSSFWKLQAKQLLERLGCTKEAAIPASAPEKKG